MTKASFYIIDGLAMLYRAMLVKGPPLSTRLPSGVVEPTKGTYYFTRMLLKLSNERKPDYFAIALDAPRDTLERKSLFPAYKSNREPRKNEQHVQIARSLQIAKLLGVPLIEFPRMEADDIIATLCDICAGKECKVVIVSRDKDMHQLIRHDEVEMFDPLTNTTWREADVFEKWGVPPYKVPDVQALMGDSTDKVPGVPGIGEKGAKELIAQFGDLDGVLANLEDVPGKAQARLVEAHESGHLALMRELVTLRRDLEIRADPDELAWDGPNMEAGRKLFRYLGFRRWS